MRSADAACYGDEVRRDVATTSSTGAARALAHVDALYSFACWLARDKVLAEDLVQETFARCLASPPESAEGPQLKAFLFRILRNAFLDQKRREQRSPIRAGTAVPEHADAAAHATDPLRGDFEIDRLRTLVAEEIEAALHALSEEQRSVVLLDLEGLSEQEIAEVMACAPGTVKSRLARARAALRAQLAEYAR